MICGIASLVGRNVAAANGAQPREIARFASELGMVHDTIFPRPTHRVHLGATDISL